jgi:hypothetical protein
MAKKEIRAKELSQSKREGEVPVRFLALLLLENVSSEIGSRSIYCGSGSSSQTFDSKTT